MGTRKTSEITALEDRLNACRTVELLTEQYRPIYKAGDMVVVEGDASLQSDDTVFMEFVDNQQGLGLFVSRGPQVIRVRGFFDGGATRQFKADTVTFMGRVVATFRP